MTKKYSVEELNEIISWEDGISGVLAYGVRSNDIEDSDIAELWALAEDSYTSLEDDIRDIEELLEFKLQELGKIQRV